MDKLTILTKQTPDTRTPWERFVSDFLGAAPVRCFGCSKFVWPFQIGLYETLHEKGEETVTWFGHEKCDKRRTT